VKNPAAEKAAQRFGATRTAWAEQLIAVRSDMVNVLRVASNLATNELTWALGETHPALGPLLRKHSDAYYAGLGEIAVQMAERTAESLEAVRYLSLLRQLIQTGDATLVAAGSTPSIFDQTRMVGYKATDGDVFLLPQVTRARIEKTFGKDALSNLSDKTLYAQLADLGVLIPGRDGKSTTATRLGGDLVRALHLRASAIFEDEEAPA
jgi:hypothetical protein